MEAADYIMDTDFQAFISYWELHRQCPLPFSDWLRDRGLDRQADVAYWAWKQEIRYGYGVGQCGLYPWSRIINDKLRVSWHSIDTAICDYLPGLNGDVINFDSFIESIIWLLDTYEIPNES